MNPGSLLHSLQNLASEIHEVNPAECPALIGLLEQLKAQAWVRMVSPPSASGHDENDLMDMAQVAKRLNIAECRAYELGRQGKIQTVKIGKYVRVPRAALENYQLTLVGQVKY
jgi:excisionase family DNA binding protein